MKNTLYKTESGETTYVFVLRKRQIIALGALIIALFTGAVLLQDDSHGTISQGDELEINE